MHAETSAFAAGAGEPAAENRDRVAPSLAAASLPGLVTDLVNDAIDLIALESRAAALRLAALVVLSVAGACFALFAWLGLSAIGVVALVESGWKPAVALAALAALNALLATIAVFVVRRTAHSVLFGPVEERGRDRRTEGR